MLISTLKLFTSLSSLFLQENAGLVVPWLIGLLTFISFEALGLVYANVLKDQIFGVSREKRFMEIGITIKA